MSLLWRTDSEERAKAKKATKYRSWTKDDFQMLRTMMREKAKTSVIARKLKRTPTATRQKAASLGVKLAGLQRERRV
jgi:hypothetical protein